MQPKELKGNLTEVQRPPLIPKELEPVLKDILQREYCDGELSIPEVQEYIKTQYNIPIKKRQITYRLEKWSLWKVDHQARSPTSIQPGDLPTESDHGTAPAVFEHPDSTNTDFSFGSIPTETFYQFPEYESHGRDRHRKLSQTMTVRTTPIVSYTEALDTGPDLTMLSESSAADTEDLGSTPTTLECGAQIPWSERSYRMHCTNTSLDPYSGQLLDIQPGWQITRIRDAFADMSRNHETIKECTGIHDQYFSAEDPPRLLRYDGNLSLLNSMVAKMNNNPTAPMTTFFRRINEILGSLFERALSYPTLPELTVSELHSSLRLALVMLSCGYNDDASCCLEFLLWCWNAQNIFSADENAEKDPFLHSTRIIMWLLCSGRCDDNDVVCYNLWKFCQNAYRARSYERSNEHNFNTQQILIVGRLALVAYLQGFELLFQHLRDFWDEYASDLFAKKLHKNPRCPQKILFGYIDSKITHPRSIDSINSWIGIDHDPLVAEIERLLRWMRKQISLHTTLTKQEQIGVESLWRHIAPLQSTVQLEQQLLLSYLSYQGSRDDPPAAQWLIDEDRGHLPCIIWLEWLSDDFPHLTFSILSHLTTSDRHSHSDTLGSEVWSTRMLNAVDRLLNDVRGTTAKFCAVANASCCESRGDALNGLRNIWTAPIRINLPEDVTVSGQRLQHLTRHLVCSTALLGSMVSGTTQNCESTLAAGFHDHTLLNTPKSSLSGFESMKSTSFRAKNVTQRRRTSFSSCSSPHQQRSDFSGASLMNNLLGPTTNVSQSSHKIGSWYSTSDGQEIEKATNATIDDVMDLDI